MEQKTREEQRSFIANQIIIEYQLGLCPIRTFGDFVNIFEGRMIKKKGECSEEDCEWAFDYIERFNKANKK